MPVGGDAPGSDVIDGVEVDLIQNLTPPFQLESPLALHLPLKFPVSLTSQMSSNDDDDGRIGILIVASVL